MADSDDRTPRSFEGEATDLTKRQMERRISSLEKDIIALTHENGYLAERRNSYAAVAISSSVSKYAFLAFCAWCVVLTARAMAGQETSIGVLIGILFNAQMSATIAWLLAFISGGGWFMERRLRKKRITELAANVAQLESLLDPSRSSSKIGEIGTFRASERDRRWLKDDN